MKWKERPSIREVELKLKAARKCLAQGNRFFGPCVKKLVSEFAALNIGDSSEIWPLLAILMEEISPAHYAGTHPPMKTLDTSLNSELFVFVWESKTMKQFMYVKFVVKNDIFYYFSLHKSNRP